MNALRELELLDISSMNSVMLSDYRKCLIACIKVYNYSDEDLGKIDYVIHRIDRKLGLYEKQTNT